MAEDERVFQSMEDPEWVDKNRTLIVSSRGITASQRQFMLSIFGLLPHSKKEFKLQKNDVREQIQELCDTHRTRFFMYFEVKKKINYCLWLGKYPEGPTVKFMLDGIVQNRDVKFQGNSVKGARHILSFDSSMDTNPKLKIAKQLLIGAFNVPKYHPKSTAVIDHALNFVNSAPNEISFKNYQIFREVVSKTENKVDLHEIGPRFILRISCILEGVLGGEVIYRAPIVKKLLKKSKIDKRKSQKNEQVGDINLFGQELK